MNLDEGDTLVAIKRIPKIEGADNNGEPPTASAVETAEEVAEP